ncbi:MAG: VOC family protein [Acuticoccus sp.]
MSMMRKDTVVWTEIPVSDMERAKTFYAGLLGAPLVDETGGPNPLAMLPRDSEDVVAGHLYPGKPAAKGTGPTVHLAVSVPLEEAMTRVREGGGEVVSETITIPAGSFFYAIDTEGNSVGVFKV